MSSIVQTLPVNENWEEWMYQYNMLDPCDLNRIFNKPATELPKPPPVMFISDGQATEYPDPLSDKIKKVIEFENQSSHKPATDLIDPTSGQAPLDQTYLQDDKIKDEVRLLRHETITGSGQGTCANDPTCTLQKEAPPPSGCELEMGKRKRDSTSPDSHLHAPKATRTRRRTSSKKHLNNELLWLNQSLKSIQVMKSSCDDEDIKETAPIWAGKLLRELTELEEYMRQWGAEDEKVTRQWDR